MTFWYPSQDWTAMYFPASWEAHAGLSHVANFVGRTDRRPVLCFCSDPLYFCYLQVRPK